MFGTETFATLLGYAGDLWAEISVVFVLMGALYVAGRGSRIARSLVG